MSTDKKILIFSANPKDTKDLDLKREIREIKDRLKRAKHGRKFTVHLTGAVRIQDFQQELLEHEPQIVHFCGHGEEEGILVEDEQEKSVLIPSEALASLFSLCAEHVECVLLNSCHSHVQAEAISQHIPCVIGMQKDVGDDASVEFAAGFYNALGFGKSIEQAFAFGKNAVQLYDLPDHLTPILLQRRAKAKPPEKIVLLSADPLDEPQNWNPYIEQIKKKTSCPIEQQSLNIENLNSLQEDAYLLILSKIIKNKLLIENEYLCKDTISFKQLDENIGNRQLAGLFLFVDQLPEEESTAELTLPTFLLPVENKNHLNTVLYQLFTRKNIDCDNRSQVLNKAAFHLSALHGKSHFKHERTNLPDSIDRQKLKGFVGRSDDLRHICSALMDLDQGEFLTVKGSGGIGKTHTVKKIAVALADRALFPGGIYFIDCEPVTDSKQFQFKAATVFGLELAEDLWEHLRDHHDQQERLVIFDNFEPLLYLDEEQEIKTILSRMADYTKALVTSREVLGMEGETVHQMRRLTTDEAVELFTAEFKVPLEEEELLRQDILSRQLDNNPQAIKLITGQLPKGKNLEKLREELEENLFGKVCIDELEVFSSGPDSNIERRDSIYASILYSYRLLNEQEKMTFELLSLFPDGIHMEEFKRLTSKADKKDKLPLALITDRLLDTLEKKSMLENNGGQLKLQSMIGRFAQAMLKQRDDIAQLYRNAFTYNRRLARVLHQIKRTSKRVTALDIFSGQQGNFLAAIRYCDRFDADKEELLDYFDDLVDLFAIVCSLDRFIYELSNKINMFQNKERQCSEAILLWAKYYNGEFHQAFANLQHLLPHDQINSLDRTILSERLMAPLVLDIYKMEGEILLATDYAIRHHFTAHGYPSSLLYIGEYNLNLTKLCQDTFSTFEILANINQSPLERIDTYLTALHKKNHIERMQASYTRAKLKPLQKERIEPLVTANPYTRGLKKLMLAFIEEDMEKADELYQEAAEHLWHIRYYHVECLYFYAKFLQQQGDARFEDVHQEGLKLSQKHHYRFLQYRFEELIEPSGQPYDQRDYPLPDNQDFSEYINFLIKHNQERNSMKGKVQRRRG